MILRNLPERSVGLRDACDHFRQGDAGHLGTAVSLRHGDAPQPALGEQVQLCIGQPPLTIAYHAVAPQLLGNVFGDRQGLGVVGNQKWGHQCSPEPERYGGHTASNGRAKARAAGMGRYEVRKSSRWLTGLSRSRNAGQGGCHSGDRRPPRDISSAPDRAGCARVHCASGGPG